MEIVELTLILVHSLEITIFTILINQPLSLNIFGWILLWLIFAVLVVVSSVAIEAIAEIFGVKTNEIKNEDEAITQDKIDFTRHSKVSITGVSLTIVSNLMAFAFIFRSIILLAARDPSNSLQSTIYEFILCYFSILSMHLVIHFIIESIVNLRNIMRLRNRNDVSSSIDFSEKNALLENHEF